MPCTARVLFAPEETAKSWPRDVPLSVTVC